MKLEVSAAPSRHCWSGRFRKGHWFPVQVGSQRESSSKLCAFTNNVQGEKKKTIPFLMDLLTSEAPLLSTHTGAGLPSADPSRKYSSK